MFKTQANLVLRELTFSLKKINEDEVNSFIKSILKARKIVVIGAGRMGFSSKAFSMRLSHLGFNSYALGDTNLPSINKNDLLIVNSGSGETQTIYDLSLIAKKKGVKIALITTNKKSRIGKISDLIVEIDGPSKVNKEFHSKQPMTTLNEQVTWIFFDSITLLLINKIKNKNLWENHSILE